MISKEEKIEYLRRIINPPPLFITCGICGRKGFQSMWKINDLDVVICTDCADEFRGRYIDDTSKMLIYPTYLEGLE